MQGPLSEMTMERAYAGLLGKRSFPARHLHQFVISNTELDPIRHSQTGPILQKTPRSVIPSGLSAGQSGTKAVWNLHRTCTLNRLHPHVDYTLVHATPCRRDRLPYAGGALTRQSVLGQTDSAVHQCLTQERKHRQPSCLPDDLIPCGCVGEPDCVLEPPCRLKNFRRTYMWSEGLRVFSSRTHAGESSPALPSCSESNARNASSLYATID